MFKQRTLFIVGAGASKEFGLPLGTALASAVAAKTDIQIRDYHELTGRGDKDLFFQLQRHHRQTINEHLRACWQIRDGVEFNSSIDDFLDVHASNAEIQLVGKMAIVKSILEEERKSTLYFDRSNIYNKLKVSRFEDTWIIKLVRMLARGVPKEKRAEIFANIAFIVFNYDRCIEHCLLHAVAQVYSIEEREAAEILKGLAIIHPYGSTGALKIAATAAGVSFGGEFERLSEDYHALAGSIKTYTEQVSDAEELKAIHDQISQATRIVFLGFAFHDQNVALLKSKAQYGMKEIYATAFGMSETDVEIAKAQLWQCFDGEMRYRTQERTIFRSDLTASSLFDQYAKSLPN